MPGAAVLCARAAYRTGVGIVKSVTPKSIYPVFISAVPEAVLSPMESFSASEQSHTCACLVGCGMGNNENTKKIVLDILKNYKGPIVIDADGINVLSQNIEIIKQFSKDVIITPHPKEASRVLGVSVEEIQNNREKYLKMLAEKSGAVTLLKGANTLVFANGKTYILENDNSGLATAGSGDVLSGIIVSLLSLGLSPENAATLGAFIHNRAGFLASKRLSETSMCASDIIESIAELFCNLS